MLEEFLNKLKNELEDIQNELKSIDKENITEENINNILNISNKFATLINSDIPNKENIINSISNSDYIED